jgi:anthranilate synthase component I
METDTIQNRLNLRPGEYLTAVNDQAKPLVIPLCAEIPLPRCSPLDVFLDTRKGNGFLLESMEGNEKIARYSYIGTDPACVVTLGRDVSVTGSDAFVAITREPEGENPVDRIRSILSRFNYVNLRAPRFYGGMVGYFAYDIVNSLFFQVKNNRKKLAGETPDARFMLTKDCIVFDHRDRRLFIFSSPFLTYDTDPAAEYRRCAAHIEVLGKQIATIAEKPSVPPISPWLDHKSCWRFQTTQTGKNSRVQSKR